MVHAHAPDAATRARRQRRVSLEVRTLTISLRDALDDLRMMRGLSERERIALRREWCERAAIGLQDVRVLSMRMTAITRDGSLARDDAALLDHADAEVAALTEPAA
jgi:hypothetical protein